MKGRIPSDFIQSLVARIDIVDIIQARTPLKKAGHEYKACCPFHDEKSPSFTVSQQKQFYHCFGCGAHGNAIGFLMAYDLLEFVDAVETLASNAGITIPYDSTDTAPTENFKPLYAALEEAADAYIDALKKSPEAITYFKKRGISGEQAKHFKLGYAPSGWGFLGDKAKANADLKAAWLKTGMLISKDSTAYDRFRDRVTFPIRDSRGRILGFGGRTLSNDPAKYLNSPETPVFSKGEHLYGLYEAKQHHRQLDQLLVVEGYMDVVSLAEKGIHCAVATLGTAVTTKHLQQLFKHAPKIIFCFDADKAGKAAAWKALCSSLTLLRDGVTLAFLFLPEGEDPDSFIQKNGKIAFLSCLEKAHPLTQFFFEKLAADTPPDTLESKARLAKMAMQHIDTMPKSFLKELMCQKLSHIVDLDNTVINELHQQPNTAPPIQAVSNKPRSTSIAGAIKYCLALLLQHPDIAGETALPDNIEDYHMLGAKLLSQLHKAAHSNPKITLGAMLAINQSPKAQSLMVTLNELPLNLEIDPKQAYVNALRRVQSTYKKQKLDQLIEKSTKTPLTNAEKAQMQAWLK